MYVKHRNEIRIHDIVTFAENTISDTTPFSAEALSSNLCRPLKV
jgi:hypothetical protein